MMNPDTYARLARDNGTGPGWTKVAQAVAGSVPTASIDRIWLFAPVRREEREWGTAVLSCRTDEERCRIFTASYLMVVRGRERGRGKVTIEEVGESPMEVVHEVIAGVQERTGETSPPAEIAPTQWFAEQDAGAAPVPDDGPPADTFAVGVPVTFDTLHEATER